MTSASLYVIPDKKCLSSLIFHIRAAHDGFPEYVIDSLRSAFATFKQGLTAKEYDVQLYTEFVCSHIIAANPNWWTVQGCIDIDMVDCPDDVKEIDETIDFCLDKLKAEALSSDHEYTITLKSDEKTPTWVVEYYTLDDTDAEVLEKVIIN